MAPQVWTSRPQPQPGEPHEGLAFAPQPQSARYLRARPARPDRLRRVRADQVLRARLHPAGPAVGGALLRRRHHHRPEVLDHPARAGEGDGELAGALARQLIGCPSPGCR